MIVGVTVSEQGEPIQRLAVVGKVSIGRVVKRDCATCKGKAGNKGCALCYGQGYITFPQKLDHFVFSRKNPETNEWVEDKALAKSYSPDGQPREIPIVLMSDELQHVFPHELAWWTTTERRCWGDGRQATRRTEDHPEGQPWTPCGEECPDLQEGRCKPSANLYFILADRPQLGGVWKLHTTSYQSVRQLYSSLDQIKNLLGRLAGIRMRMVVRPNRTSYECNRPRQDCPRGAHKHTTTVYLVNLELEAKDFKTLAETMSSPALAFDNARKQLSTGRVVQYEVEEEPEPELVREIQPEFHPTEEQAQAQEAEQAQSKPDGKGRKQAAPPTEKKYVNIISVGQAKRFWAIARENGWKDEEVKKLIKQHGFESTKDITVDKYEQIIQRLQAPEPPVEVEPEITDEDVPL